MSEVAGQYAEPRSLPSERQKDIVTKIRQCCNSYFVHFEKIECKDLKDHTMKQNYGAL